MIEITVKLIPHGRRDLKPETLGVCVIANTGKGTPTKGKYFYALKGKSNKVLREGYINDFPRKRLLAWDLLYRILHECFGARNPPSPPKEKYCDYCGETHEPRWCDR